MICTDQLPPFVIIPGSSQPADRIDSPYQCLCRETAESAQDQGIDDLDTLPNWVRRLIKRMKLRTIETQEGTYSEFEVELMDKDRALELAMKHFGLLIPEQPNPNTSPHRQFLEELAKPGRPNPIQQRLLGEQKKLEQMRRDGAEEREP